MQEELVRKILLEKIGGEAQSITPLTGGQVGHVFRLETDARAYVIKLVKAWEEKPFSEEPVDDRVYGSRWSNLVPAYETLHKSGIPLPKLYASGTLPDDDTHYEILDYLDGDSDDYSPEWFEALGTSLGRLHAITRPYQGWVGLTEPYRETWETAFTKSLQSQLAAAKPLLEQELYGVIEQYSIHAAKKLNEPTEFVLSHTDGFQGVFKKNDNEWKLLGVIDIEDYQFVDKRFVLAGLELSHSLEGRLVPQEFWSSYSAYSDPGSLEFKKLFQIYYLLVWIRVLKDQPEHLRKSVAKLNELAKDFGPLN